MPKTDIDYSNTIIYKITCKDTAITDVYVGHTTNFVQRKHSHKQNTMNNNINHCKLYQVMRANGGWNNWKMEIVHFFDCKDQYEARKKEQEYFESLKATLNSVEPMPKPIINSDTTLQEIFLINNIKKNNFNCKVCKVNFISNKAIKNHNNTNKHKKNTELAVNVTDEIIIEDNITEYKYTCTTCTFNTNNKKDYNKHLITEKHKHNINILENIQNKEENIQKNEENIIITKQKQYLCSCGKSYSHRTGISRHKSMCKYVANIIQPPNLGEDLNNMMNILREFVKSNTELQIQMIEFFKHLII
jgi:hypothetical protein